MLVIANPITGELMRVGRHAVRFPDLDAVAQWFRDRPWFSATYEIRALQAGDEVVLGKPHIPTRSVYACD